MLLGSAVVVARGAVALGVGVGVGVGSGVEVTGGAAAGVDAAVGVDAGGAADRALQFSRIGRRARAEGRVEQVTPVPVPRPRPAWLEGRGAALQTATYETARLRHPGYDIYFVESEWRNWTTGKEAVRDPDRAFLAFFRSYAEKNPL